MRILVGIMHCIENELDQCIHSIHSQDFTNHEHFIISNLPNKIAHETLYRTFMDRAEEFDLFVKVDADMVLARVTFFSEIIEEFRSSKELELLQIAVHDFFTNKYVFGLHVYRNSVKWDFNQDNVFVDTTAKINKTINDKSKLAPAAYHCPDPSDFQSFHFGLHKAVKIIQRKNVISLYDSSCYHRGYFKKLYEHSKTNKLSRPHAMAVLAAMISFQNNFYHKHVDFNNSQVQELFRKYNNLKSEDLWKAIENEKPLLFKILPTDVYLELKFLRFVPFKYPLWKLILKKIIKGERTRLEQKSVFELDR